MGLRTVGRIVAAAAVVALTGAPAFASGAATPADKGARANQQARPDPKALHCVRETPTGSNITKRICYSDADWAELQRLASESHAQGRDRSTFCASVNREC